MWLARLRRTKERPLGMLDELVELLPVKNATPKKGPAAHRIGSAKRCVGMVVGAVRMKSSSQRDSERAKELSATFRNPKDPRKTCRASSDEQNNSKSPSTRRIGAQKGYQRVVVGSI